MQFFILFFMLVIALQPSWAASASKTASTQIIPRIVKRQEPPTHLIVSHVDRAGLHFFGGELGHIFFEGAYTQNNLDSPVAWYSLKLSNAGLITGMAFAPSITNQIDTLVYVTSAKGHIYKNSNGLLKGDWQQVFTMDKDDVVPLFNIAALDNNRVFAVGAFGTLLETVDQGQTWRVLDEQLDNLDGGHLYKMHVVPDKIQQKYGVQAIIIGEFGQIFTLATKGTDKNHWQSLRLDSGTTLFDGEFLSEHWFLMFGVDGVIAALDLRNGALSEGVLCEAISVNSAVADNTGRNLLLAGAQERFLRISLLDEGASTPPALTCQSSGVHQRGLVGLALRGHELLVYGHKGLHVKNALKLMPELSLPKDIQWH